MKIILLFFGILFCLVLTTPATYAANLNVTTFYTQTGGIKGALNQVGNLVNGVNVCPADPTDGCDFSSDPGYSNNGTTNDPSDDTYSGDLLIRTNDVFEVDAGWSWNGVANGPEEEVTIIGTLPTTGEYEWTDIPGSCDPNGSSISADRLTITCVRNDFTNTPTYAEDLLFTARVLGSTPNGTQPGDISFEVSGQNATTVTDDTDGYSLTVTASPRWNLDKQLYAVRAGQLFDHDNDPATPDIVGYIVNYLFLIESDEVSGTTDDAPAFLGNESMGSNATFDFTDEIDDIAPNAQLIDCTMEGRSPQHDGYVGTTRPVTKNDGIHSANPEQLIPQPGGAQQVTCTQTGTTINVQVTGVDATLDHAPTHNYSGAQMPVNRKIAAIGSINIFVPLSDVEDGDDHANNTGDDGVLHTNNKLRNFDPTTPTGHSNFGADTEALNDNDLPLGLYGTRGLFSKYYRGEQSNIFTYPGGAVTARSGDGVVTAGYEFSTFLINNNTGGTAYTEEMCDVVDAYRLEVQDIEDNTIYNTIKTAYGDAYHDNTSPVMYRIWNGSGDYANNQPVGPYEFEYSSHYVDNSWLPSRGGDQNVSHKTEIENECNEATGWFASADDARNDPSGIGAVTKIKIKTRNGVTHPPTSFAYIWINHKVRADDLLTRQPLQNGDEIVNYSAWAFNGAAFTGASYMPKQYPELTANTNGDRVTFSGGKVRINKTANVANTAPGQFVQFTLESSYTNDTGISEIGHVTIKDIMPKGILYVPGSVGGASEPVIGSCADVDASLTCSDGDNQVLIWDLGDRNTQDSIDDIVFDGKVSTTAPAGTVTNLSVIESPSDASALTQRQSSVGLNISVPATLNIIKSTIDVGQREYTTTGEDIDYEVDLRNGKPGALTNLDIIDILPFIGDGNSGAIKFNTISTERNPGTDHQGSNEFVSMNLRQHPDSSSACDVSANGGVEYYYTTALPTTINIAPSVGAENVIGGLSTIWAQGTATDPPAGMSKADVTAVRAVGPTMSADAICQLQLKMHINNNLAGDLYTNSAGAAATGVTLPVMSNAEVVSIVGSSLSNKVWIDTNADGIQDAGENGLANVTVHLLDSNSNPVENPATGQPYVVQTDAQGEYIFDGLRHGDYKVKFDLPATYFSSPKDAGADDAVDSDIDTSGLTDTVALGIDVDIDTLDAGVYHIAHLGDRVWQDDDADGIQDAGENGIANVTLRLLDASGNPVDNPNNPGTPYEVTTNSQGDYLFENLIPGTYIVEIVPPTGYIGVPQNQGGDSTADNDFSRTTNRSEPVTLSSGEHEVNIDAGLYPLASIGDKVWRDDERDGVQADWEPGLEGVVVELLDGAGNPVDDPHNPGTPYTVTTGADGVYLFENVEPGDYQLKFTPPADYNPTDKDQGGDDAKDSDINTSTLTTDTITVASGENNISVDAGFYALYTNIFDPPHAIKTVAETGENEIEWTMVWINDGNTVAVHTQVLDDVPTGTTYVTGSVICDARGASTTNACVYDTAHNRIRWDGDIAPDPGGTTEENSLNEVVIRYRTTISPEMERVENQARAHWDANGDGDYTDDIDRGQEGVVSDDTEIYGTDPTIWIIEEKAQGNSSIGNYIWNDKDGDGKQDDDEPGLEDIRVKLIWAGPDGIFGTDDDHVWRTETNHNGHYTFDNLPTGKFKVIVKDADVKGWIQTYENSNNMNGQVIVTLGENDHHTKADFGYSRKETKLAKTGDNLLLVIISIVTLLLGWSLVNKKELMKTM